MHNAFLNIKFWVNTLVKNYCFIKELLTYYYKSSANACISLGQNEEDKEIWCVRFHGCSFSVIYVHYHIYIQILLGTNNEQVILCIELQFSVELSTKIII